MNRFIEEKKRTHYCGELNARDEGTEVVLFGWVQRRRDLGGLIFVDLRDREGIVQIVFDPDADEALHSEARKIRGEYVLAVLGKVRRRRAGMENT